MAEMERFACIFRRGESAIQGKPYRAKNKGIDQFLNWSMNAPPGRSDMIRISYPPRPKRSSSVWHGAGREGLGYSLPENRAKRIVPAQSAGTPSPPKEKVSRFDRKTLRGVHRLFRGVHFLFRGCKQQRGCKVNDWGIPSNWNLSANTFTDRKMLL